MSMRAAEDASPAQWVVDSLTTFAESVASLVPARFEVYARILHPGWVGGDDGRDVTWAEIAAANERTIHPEVQFPALVHEGSFDHAGNVLDRQFGVWEGPPDEGSLDLVIIQALIPWLRDHTTTPQRCYFAYWNGWGDPTPMVAVRSSPLGILQRARAQNEAEVRIQAQFAGAPRGQRDIASSFETPAREVVPLRGNARRRAHRLVREGGVPLSIGESIGGPPMFCGRTAPYMLSTTGTVSLPNRKRRSRDSPRPSSRLRPPGLKPPSMKPIPSSAPTSAHEERRSPRRKSKPLGRPDCGFGHSTPRKRASTELTVPSATSYGKS